jgi:hypothetical protein
MNIGEIRAKNKKQLTILLSVLALLLVINGIGALPENKSDVAVNTTSIESNADITNTEIPAKSPPQEITILDETTTPTPPQETTTKTEETQSTDIPSQQSTVTGISIKDIPVYTGSGAYIAINDNIPFFSESDYTTIAFESYSNLDSLGRCGVAYANICLEIMPTTERGSIGQVRPTGWHTVTYDIVEGRYLYNRCHLIGYQLSAENANTKNLITGTRYFNVKGMLPFENMVADYVKETNNHVLYRVTPMFDENNLVATGVLMEALSVEDKGEGISFNVFCYNVQAGVIIDYATGESTIDNATTATTPEPTTLPNTETVPPTAQPSSGTGTTYILNTNTYKFHYPSCSSVGQINNANKQEYTGDKADLIAQGYDPCGICHP